MRRKKATSSPRSSTWGLSWWNGSRPAGVVGFGKRWALLGGRLLLGGSMVSWLTGCGGGGNGQNRPPSASATANQPAKVAEGVAFTVGEYSVAPGWQIADALGGFGASGVIINNTADEAGEAYFRMTVLADGKVLAAIDCNTSEITAGGEQEARCLDTGLDHPMARRHRFQTGWDSIIIEPTPADF